MYYMKKENELQHSAKGTHWSKKDHKYVKKEDGRYYYKDRSKGNTTDKKTDDYPLADLSEEEIEAQAAEKAKQSLAEEQIAWRLSPEKYEMRKMQYQIELHWNRTAQRNARNAKEEIKKKEAEKAKKALASTFKKISGIKINGEGMDTYSRLRKQYKESGQKEAYGMSWEDYIKSGMYKKYAVDKTIADTKIAISAKKREKKS